MEVNQRVYHLRKHDQYAKEGWCMILKLNSPKANVLWEDNGKWGTVDVRDLLTEEEAKMQGFE